MYAKSIFTYCLNQNGKHTCRLSHNVAKRLHSPSITLPVTSFLCIIFPEFVATCLTWWFPVWDQWQPLVALVQTGL